MEEFLHKIPGFYSKALLFCLAICFSATMAVHSQANLISNGDFESGTTGWSVWGATLASSTDSHSGSLAAKVSNRKNPWDAIVKDVTGLLVNGETYTLSAWVKITGPCANFRATIGFTVDGTTSYKAYLWTTSPVIGSYVFYTETFTVSWTGNLQTANLYFETESSGGIYPDYIIDDVVFTGKSQNPDPDKFTGPGLKDIKSQMLIGGAVTDGNKTYFNNETVKALVLQDCNSATVQCYPAWGRWDESQRHVYHLENFNAQVREMKEKNMRLTSHMLLGWDQYFPDWYKTGDFPPDTLEAMMESWLHAIISENGNDTLVDVWNVVNESIAWDGKGGYWPEDAANQNNACEMQKMGYEPDSSGLTGNMKVNDTHPVYIRKAFEFARTLTDKKLELRETSCEFPTDQKYEAFYQLAMHLKKLGAPVDVIGFQTHLDIGKNYDWEGYVNNIKRFRKLGYEVIIPEVDVGDVAKSWTSDKAEMQKMVYYKLITSAIRGGASDLQTWGFIDNNNNGWRNGENAFQYNSSIEPKPGYYGIKEALTDMSHILFWEMNSPLNDTMPDVMLYNNYGTLNNFETSPLVVGFKSFALKFDGVDDYISTGILSDSISDDFTFSCFIKTSSSKEGIIADLASETSSGMKLVMNENGLISLKSDGTGLVSDLPGSVAVNDGTWHFIAVQRDSANYLLYIDEAIANVNGEGTIEPYVKLTLGAKNDGSSPFEGVIDEVKLYDYAVEEESFTRNMVPFTPLNFSASNVNMIAILTWTDQSINDDGFIIERKINEGEWEEIITVGKSVFSTRDTFKLYNASYSYRVRAYNKFGKSVPSNSKILISPDDPTVGTIEMRDYGNGKMAFYPNPTSDRFTLLSSGNPSLYIVNIHGSLMMEIKNVEEKEMVDISHFPNGIYFLKITGSDQNEVVKLIKE